MPRSFPGLAAGLSVEAEVSKTLARAAGCIGAASRFCNSLGTGIRDADKTRCEVMDVSGGIGATPRSVAT